MHTHSSTALLDAMDKSSGCKGPRICHGMPQVRASCTMARFRKTPWAPGDGRGCIVPSAREGPIQAAILLRMSSWITHSYGCCAAKAARSSPPSNAPLQAEKDGPCSPRCSNRASSCQQGGHKLATHIGALLAIEHCSGQASNLGQAMVGLCTPATQSSPLSQSGAHFHAYPAAKQHKM